MNQSQEIDIRYAGQEVGPAQYLGGRVARILGTPCTGPACPDAIVRLDSDPWREGEPPAIKEVLFVPYQCRTLLRFSSEPIDPRLAPLCKLLGCQVIPASDVVWMIYHNPDVDPARFAKTFQTAIAIINSFTDESGRVIEKMRPEVAGTGNAGPLDGAAAAPVAGIVTPGDAAQQAASPGAKAAAVKGKKAAKAKM